MTLQDNLIRAARNGNLKKVKSLIEGGNVRSNAAALAAAAAAGHLACVEILISVSDRDANNWALSMAASHGQLSCINALIPVSDVNKSVAELLNENLPVSADLLTPHLLLEVLKEIIIQSKMGPECVSLMPNYQAKLLEERMRDGIKSNSTPPKERTRL